MISLFTFHLLPIALCFLPFTRYQVLTTNITLGRSRLNMGLLGVSVKEWGWLDNVGSPLRQVTNSPPQPQNWGGVQPLKDVTGVRQ